MTKKGTTKKTKPVTVVAADSDGQKGDVLLAEALAPADDRELEAAE